MPPVRAAAVLLPVLVIMDVIAITSWRAHVKWSIVASMLPGALFGIGLGWVTAAWVSDGFVRLLVGIIAVSFALVQFFADFNSAPPRKESRLRASAWASVAGYTSFVAHAGGPPFQAYVLPLKLQKELVAGTNVVFFFTVNSVKLVPYFALGQFDAQNLRLSATLVPIAIAGVVAGIWLVRRISQRWFYNITYAGLFAIGLKLIYDSLPALMCRRINEPAAAQFGDSVLDVELLPLDFGDFRIGDARMQSGIVKAGFQFLVAYFQLGNMGICCQENLRSRRIRVMTVR